ncbi:hypothetical protein EC988_007797 [Linderina pennispora]|nr:hypothetical protein EC988_007797 [Linderina pennispora]
MKHPPGSLLWSRTRRPVQALRQFSHKSNDTQRAAAHSSQKEQFAVYRIDTNGVQHPLQGKYDTRAEAERIASHYDSLGHKNGYFVKRVSRG